MISGKYLPAPVKLLLQFVLLAGIPLVALGWLGKDLLQQDRELENQRQRDRIENTANTLADLFDRTLSAWENVQSGAGPGTVPTLPRDAIFLILDSRGALRQQSVRLPYYPVIADPERSTNLFAAAEAQEFRDNDPAQAAEAYRALASGRDPSIRGAALMRLARSLRAQQKTQEALLVYGEIAAMGESRVAGDPAELLARRERVTLYRLAGDEQAAERERKMLASVLSEGRFVIDRATFDLYAESAELKEPPKNMAMAETVQHFWPRWVQETQGRAVWGTAGIAFASVWRKTAGGTAALAGFVRPDPGAASSVAKRRNLLATGFGLMILIICAASYFVFRAINRELGVARLQSEFVSAVSHEFRTPLTAMRHLTEMLEEGDTPGDRLPPYYRALSKEIRRLQSLVESLLDFGRMEAGGQTYRMEDTNATELAGQVVDEFRDTLNLRQSSFGMV